VNYLLAPSIFPFVYFVVPTAFSRVKSKRRFSVAFECFNLETAVGTTDFTDNTDEEDVWGERPFTRQVRVPGASNGDVTVSHPWNPWNPWFLNCRISVQRSKGLTDKVRKVWPFFFL